MRNGNHLKSCVGEIRVKRICLTKELVYSTFCFIILVYAHLLILQLVEFKNVKTGVYEIVLKVAELNMTKP